jgi:hypothetical protein
MTKQDKVAKVMHEWKNGRLTSNGKKVTDYDQAIAIALSEAGLSKYAEGGSIESKKQAILDFINSFPDKPKNWSEATDDLPELHYDIAEEYGSKYDFDFNKRSSLRDRNLRHKQHAKSLLNKLSDEEIGKIYSKWEETLEDKYAEGGGIGFIPMDLHEELTHIAKFGGVKSEKDVIGILNAIVDSGLTDNDLETKPTRTATQYELVLDKKTEEVWAKVKGNYEGDLKGNQYFSSLYEIIKRNNSNDAKLIERYKPFRKLSKEGELMERGGMYSKGGNVIERRYVNKDEDYETRYAKDKPSRMGYKDERMFAVGGGVDEWNGRIFNKYFTKEKAESIIDDLEKEDEIEGFDIGFMGEQGYTITVINAYTDRETSSNPYDLEMGRDSKGRFYIIPLKPMEDMPKQVSNKFAVGGEIGNTVSFKGDYGTPRSGVVKEKRGSSYIVSTDDGDRLVDSYEVISFSETPIAKKKRFGFFAEGGRIENQYKNRYEGDIWDNSWNLDQKYHFLSDHVNEIGFDEEFYNEKIKTTKRIQGSKGAEIGFRFVDNDKIVETKYVNLPRYVKLSLQKHIREGQYEGGGEIQSKIDKLQAVVNSKMLPEGVKETARKKIAELEKELHESKETKAEERAEENKMTGESEGERNVGMDKPEDYIEAKVKNLEASLKDKTISETQRKRDEKELALFKKATATTRAKFKVGEMVNFNNELYKIIEIKKAKDLDGEGDATWRYLLDGYGDFMIQEDLLKEYKAPSKAPTTKPTTTKAPIKKAVAKKVVEGLKPKFKVGDVVLVNYGEERGVIGAIETVSYYEKYPKSMKPTDIPHYEIKGASKDISESNLELYKAPKADHKKLVAKLKAKKGDKEYDNRASLNTETGERRKRSESSDKKREALPLGKRVSADGNVYWENRLNRGDVSKEDKFEGGGEVKGSDWGLNLNW